MGPNYFNLKQIFKASHSLLATPAKVDTSDYKAALARVFLIAFLLLNGLTALAQVTEASPPLQPPESAKSADHKEGFEGQKSFFESNGVLRLDNDWNPDENGRRQYNLRTQRFELQGSFKLLQSSAISQETLFVLRTRMEQRIVQNGQREVNHLNLDDYVKEAYFAFNRLGHQPIAILLGATEVSYGQDYPGTLDFQNDASHAMTDPDNGQIKGATIIIDELIRPFDKVSITVFSPNPDIKMASLNRIDGFSTRISKTFFETLETQASFLRKGNGYDPDLGPEQKVSFAGVYKFDLWTAYSEFVAMDHAAAYPQAAFGFTTGIQRLTGLGKLNVEQTSVHDTLDQEAIGYQLFLSKGWTLSSNLRRTSCRGGNDGCVAARGFGEGLSGHLSVQYAYGGSENDNPRSLFDVP